MKNKSISNSEWKIMKILWQTPKLTLRQIYEKTGAAEGWSYTTVRTLVTRLVEKEAVAADKSGANFKYYPLLSENECKNSEVKNRNMNYFIQWLVDCGIKMIYVSGIDEKIKRFFEQMKIIVNVKEQFDKTLLLTEITSQK